MYEWGRECFSNSRFLGVFSSGRIYVLRVNKKRERKVSLFAIYSGQTEQDRSGQNRPGQNRTGKSVEYFLDVIWFGR